MTEVKHFFQRIGVWCCRIPYRRGYGIHSPYAFQLVTKVFYDCKKYLAYTLLYGKREKTSTPVRLDKLYFRLTRYFQPQSIAYFHSSTTSLSYLLKGCLHPPKVFQLGENNAINNEITSSVDCLWVNLEHQQETETARYLRLAHDGTIGIFQGIHASVQAQAFWHKLLQEEKVRVSFDLYWVGIISFEQRLNKQDYIINF